MKNMGLKDKIKKGLGALGLIGMLGSPVYNSGCTELAILGAGKMIADSNREAAEIKAAAANQNRTYQPNNLENNPGVRKISNTPWGEVYIVSCNYHEDFNRNGKLDWDEFVGIKDRFAANERETIYISSTGRPFNGIHYKLLNQNGEIVEASSLNATTMAMSSQYNVPITWLKENYPSGLPSGMVDKLGTGNYKIVWDSENTLIATFDFSINN